MTVSHFFFLHMSIGPWRIARWFQLFVASFLEEQHHWKMCFITFDILSTFSSHELVEYRKKLIAMLKPTYIFGLREIKCETKAFKIRLKICRMRLKALFVFWCNLLCLYPLISFIQKEQFMNQKKERKISLSKSKSTKRMKIYKKIQVPKSEVNINESDQQSTANEQIIIIKWFVWRKWA